MTGARAYLARLAELAGDYGFGFVHHYDKKVRPQAAEHAAAYLSSYFVKGRGEKAPLWESVASGAMPTSIIHVSTELTQRTRCTMRNLRLRRAVFVVWRADLPLSEIDVVARLIAAFPSAVPCAHGRSVIRVRSTAASVRYALAIWTRTS
jgi:hypothetical protein